MDALLESRRFHEIDALKAFAITGVVFGHMSFVGRFPPGAMALVEWLQTWLTSWAPLAFFWASGFLVQRSISRRKRSWTQHMKERARRLLVPFVLFSVLYSIALYLLSRFNLLDPASLPWNNSAPGMYYFVMLIPGAGHYFFLFLFVISFIIDPLLLRGWVFPGALVAAAVALALNAWWLGLPKMHHGPWPDLLGISSLAYALGAVAGVPGRFRSSHFAVCLAGLAALALVGWRLAVPPFYWMLVPPLIFALFQAVPKLRGFIYRTRVGQRAAAILVWHSPLLLAGVSIVLARVTQNPLILVFGSATLTILGCFAMDWFVRQFKALRWFAV